MQKKIILALLMTAFLAGGIFAQGVSMSAGGGLLFDYSGRNGTKNVADGADHSYLGGIRDTSIGGYVFFDAAYAELDVSFTYGSLSNNVWDGKAYKVMNDYKVSGWQLGFSLLGKYPVDMGGLTIFPLVGVDYNVILSLKDKDKEKVKDTFDLSQFGFLAGVGGDIDLSSSMFVRVEGLFHLRLPSKAVKDNLKKDEKATFGMGPQLKLGVGYRF